MTKQTQKTIEDYPELDKWCDDNFIHESDSTPFECYEAEAVEQKLLSMQQQIGSLTEQNKELQECKEQALEFISQIPLHSEDAHVKHYVEMATNWLNKESK